MTKTQSALPKPIKSKNPVVILKHVIKAIQAEPKRYDQGTFIDIAHEHSGRHRGYFPSCGTVCCVAGWVNVIAGNNWKDYDAQSSVAAKTLGLTWDETDDLFSGDAVGWRSMLGPKKHAAEGIKHIRRFVLKKWGKKI